MVDQQGLGRLDIAAERPRQRHSRRIMLLSAAEKLPKDIQNEQERINIILYFLALRRATLPNIEDDEDEEDFLSTFQLLTDMYEINKQGRVIYLVTSTNYVSWNLPKSVLKFNMLIDLNFFQCRSLPEEFELPNLESLSLELCHDQLLENYKPATTNLPNLTTLAIIDCNLRPSHTILSSWISFISSLPKLNFLYFKETSNGRIDPILQILHDQSLPSDRLEGLAINNHHMTGKELKGLVMGVLPKYTNLFHLRVKNNGIESLQPLSDALNNTEPISSCMASFLNNIVHFWLDGNPVVENIKTDDKEKKALLNCLSKLRRVSSITDVRISTTSSQFDNEIQDALIHNFVDGRILLEAGGNNTLPLSAWPTVLRRAAQRVTSGLFGLLRNNGPIIEALVNDDNVSTLSSLSGYETDDDYNESDEGVSTVVECNEIIEIKKLCTAVVDL